MIVADTSVWIDYVNGIDAPHTDILDHELIRNRVVTGDIIMVEFLQGFKNDREYFIAKQIMDNLEYRDFLGKENTIQAANNYRKLRKHGITVRKTIDVIIATFCIEKGFPLIHNDKDFDPMEKILGLIVKKPRCA